jgi:putative membrane protein
LLALPPRELIIAGFIENRGMVLIAGAIALIQQTGVSDRWFERVLTSDSGLIAAAATRWFGDAQLTVARGALFLTIVVLLLLLFVRLLSTAWAVVRLYDFRLTRAGDDLHATYGLLTRVSTTIPLRRVQTILIRDGVLHRLLGRRSVIVETAGGSLTTTGAPEREPIAPILRERDLPALLHEIHPGLSLSDVEWQPVDARAFGRILRGTLLWPLMLTGAAYVVLGSRALLVLPMLLIFGVVHARLRARTLAWSLTRDAVAARDGALTRTTRVARFDRVQAVALTRNPFDVRLHMARLRADTAGARGGLVIPFLGDDTAHGLHAELVARTASTAFTW